MGCQNDSDLYYCCLSQCPAPLCPSSGFKCDYERVRRDGLKIDPYHDDGTLDIANYIHGFQRVYLFQDTIYNNISMGKPDATEEEVYEAARKARCYDFIMALPEGFKTVVGEGGATLSGGEKQRISIARCILKDAPIVILDEATASVDTDNESYIQEAISELVKGKTLLVIAHRLNTIQTADQILVIDNGQIAQQGNHEELLKQPGIYQDFVNIRKSAAGWSLA